MRRCVLREASVVEKMIAFLEKHGWTITNKGKPKNRRGIDIKGYRHGRTIWIEAKGDQKHRLQGIHNAFPQAIGQVVSRMQKGLRYRYYGIAIPSSWETQWKKKIKEMEYAWKHLKIKLYLVDEGGGVDVKNWKQMLTSK